MPNQSGLVERASQILAERGGTMSVSELAPELGIHTRSARNVFGTQLANEVRRKKDQGRVVRVAPGLYTAPEWLLEAAPVAAVAPEPAPTPSVRPRRVRKPRRVKKATSPRKTRTTAPVAAVTEDRVVMGRPTRQLEQSITAADIRKVVSSSEELLFTGMIRRVLEAREA